MGSCWSPQGLKAVADLPSREALRAQLVGAIQGPLAQLVGLLQAPQRELASSWPSGASRPRPNRPSRRDGRNRDESGRSPRGSADDKGDRG